MKYKKYKKDFDYTYTQGASLTIELLKTSPELCAEVVISPEYTDSGEIIAGLCERNNIPISISARQVEILSDKGSCLACGIFGKKTNKINTGNHIILVHPSDMGNIGTIIRTAVGFYTPDVAVIKPCADIFDPKVLRASMGAYFHARIEAFGSIEDYLSLHGGNEIYTFMLGADRRLDGMENIRQDKCFSLVFGNESSGLDAKYRNIGTPVVIPHSDEIDSLSLPVAVSVGLYSMRHGIRGNAEAEEI